MKNKTKGVMAKLPSRWQYLPVMLFLFIGMESCSTRSSDKEQTIPSRIPVPVIFDTDMGPDYDDVGALTLLHALADRNEATILATVSSNMYEYTALCIDVINTYYGRAEIPIGTPSQGVYFENEHQEKWAEALPAQFPHTNDSSTQLPDAVQVYRRILANEPDSSVVVVTVGFLTNLAHLLQSPPDPYSNLDGKQLVSQKVKCLVSMAGHFPQGREWNVYCDSTASIIVFNEWPTPIIFSGWEIGERILTGKRLIASDIPNTPAKVAYTIALRQDNPEGRQSWDQTAVLVAIKGIDPYFNTVKGRIMVHPDGSNSWQDDPDGKHQYLTNKMPIGDLSEMIEDWMMHIKMIQTN